MGLQSSAYMADILAKTSVAADTDILTNDLILTEEQLGGTSGLLRVYFTLNTGATATFELTLKRTSQAIGATAVPVIENGIVTGVTVTNSGATYPQPPIITFGGSGTGAAATAVVQGGKVVRIDVTAGGSGHDETTTVSITPIVVAKTSKFNGDKVFVLQSLGEYRFDINVHANDSINFQSNVAVTTIDEFRIDKIQIGA